MVTLFLMTMSGVFLIIPKGVFIIVYVDGILLIVTGIHPRSIRRKLQTAVTVGPRSWKTRGPEVDIAMKSPLRMGANPMQVKALFIIDGSKAKRTVGVGVFSPAWKARYSLRGQSSVFSADAAALLKAIARPSDKLIFVATDSASVMLALESPTAKHIWIQAIQNIINDRRIDILANLGR